MRLCFAWLFASTNAPCSTALISPLLYPTTLNSMPFSPGCFDHILCTLSRYHSIQHFYCLVCCRLFSATWLQQCLESLLFPLCSVREHPEFSLFRLMVRPLRVLNFHFITLMLQEPGLIALAICTQQSSRNFRLSLRKRRMSIMGTVKE